MKKRNSLLSKLIDFFTYKESARAKEFYIPKASEVQDKNSKNHANASSNSCENSSNTIKEDIQSNIDFINRSFNAPQNTDIKIREFLVADKFRAFIAFIDGMVDKVLINNSILRPVLQNAKLKDSSTFQLDSILQDIIEINIVKKVKDKNELLYEILSGNTALYVDGCDYFLVSETKGFDKRAVETPQIEGVVSGSQEAFTETLRTNITLIRKNIKSTDLTTEFIKLGRNQVLCSIVYIRGLTNPAIVDEVKRRITSVKADYISGDGFLEQFIEDSPMSLFPTVLTTERPDKTISHIIDGKVAIIVEGSPFAKIVPITFSSFIHSPEDSFMRWEYGTFLRLLRFIALIIAIFLPAFYVAITDFHQEMIPTELLIAIAQAKENVPFPTIVEVIVMELSFELIREAAVRVPGMIGNTLGIIGALIIGQAAVQANLVSPVLIIIVAVTGLSNFTIPSFAFALGIRITRFIFIISGALLGFYGITIISIIFASLLFNMKSFGVNYFGPIAPRTQKSKDVFIRYPSWKQEKREDYLNTLDPTRQPEVSRGWTEEDPNYNFEREDIND